MDPFRYRRFLEPVKNRVDSYVVVEDDGWRNNDYSSVELKVADCNRNVVLSFPTGSPARRRRGLRKLQKLRTALDILEERIRL